MCVYPAYLNARKTLVDGRRIPKSKAVDNPTCLEMRDVCISQGLNCYLEAKHYPREPIKDQLHGGRLRVQLMAVDGTPVLDNITNSELWVYYLSLSPLTMYMYVQDASCCLCSVKSYLN